jgi:hypothetical protein
LSKRHRTARGWAPILLLALGLHANAADFSSLRADRVAIERVYYSHRLGTKPPFEQAMPDVLIERLVRDDLHKKAVLEKVYGVAITPAMLAAEVERIDSTTRAPDVLAELKAALGNDGDRFARSVASPLVVERELRRRFDSDETLHAPQRRETERARDAALAARRESVTQQVVALTAATAGTVNESTWRLAARPTQQASSAATGVPPQVKGEASSGNYAIRATTQVAQALTPPERLGSSDNQIWFEDLDAELQEVLRAQLQMPGDVSAVIETPGGFLVFVAQDRNATALSAATLTIRKRSYEEWLSSLP